MNDLPFMNIEICKYSKKHNVVFYRLVGENIPYSKVIEFLNRNRRKNFPLQAFAPGCVNWDNPYLGIIETQEYKNEHKKIID